LTRTRPDPMPPTSAIDRAGYQVGLGRLAESQPNLIDSNTPDPMTAD
jgi:hypothetical protein